MYLYRRVNSKPYQRKIGLKSCESVLSSFPETKLSIPELIMAILFSVVLTLITVMSIVLNNLVIFLFFSIRKKMDAKDILLVSLAISDLLQTILGYPMEIASTGKGKWIYSSDACVFSAFSVTFLGLVSISHLLCLAAERYISIAKPFLCEIFNRKRRYAVFISIACWSYALFWAILPVFGISSYTLENKIRCSINWKGKRLADKVYIDALFALCFLLPVMIIGILFTLIGKELWQILQNARRMTGRASQMVKDTYKVGKSNSLLLLAMITFFLVAWTPYAAVSLKLAVYPNSDIPSRANMAVAIFAKSSPVFNAIIYTLVYKKFRDAFRKLLKTTRRRKKVDVEEMSHTDSVL